MDFAEDLQINEDLTSLLASPDNGQFLIDDRFETHNIFNGADLGVMWKTGRGLFSLDLLMRMAVGSTHQTCVDRRLDHASPVRAVRQTTSRTPPAACLRNAQTSASTTRNRFAVVPELGVTLGYAISPQWRATVGYTFLYWSSVVRPGDQIDRDINPNLLPPEVTPLTGLERPTFHFVESDLWVNGLSLGLERTW